MLVNEPSVNETISILRGIREKYEVHHAVNILDSSIVAAANLAHRYLTSRKLPDAAIDLVDEAAAAVRVSRDSQPEAIDQAERSKLQLEVEIRALEKEKDDASKDRLKKAKQEMRDIDDRLAPLRADYEATKQSSENIQVIRQKIDDLRAKAERAERNCKVSVLLGRMCQTLILQQMISPLPLTCATTPSPRTRRDSSN